ncbi:MAG TPA: ribosome silencing factor [Nitratidesulfovibrio sp.]|nr:ribosome silencing factor [Nitratidesulfovibrio sp.]
MKPIEKKFKDIPTAEKVATFVSWLEEKKGRDVLALDLAGLNAFAESIIIVTAGSVRHAQGLADHVLGMCDDEKIEFLRMEGYQAGQWILLDCNDVIINVFQPPVREMFRLESLWSDAPVLHDGRELAPPVEAATASAGTHSGVRRMAGKVAGARAAAVTTKRAATSSADADAEEPKPRARRKPAAPKGDGEAQ